MEGTIETEETKETKETKKRKRSLYQIFVRDIPYVP